MEFAKETCGQDMANHEVKCCRCKNKHLYGDRIMTPAKDGWSNCVCPRCGAHSYYDLTIEAQTKPNQPC